MESAAYFLEKAAQCRRLAASITARDDPATHVLLSLAEEFDAKAATYLAHKYVARGDTHGDDAVPIDPATPVKPDRGGDGSEGDR